jgi:integrase/recombinase XerD
MQSINKIWIKIWLEELTRRKYSPSTIKNHVNSLNSFKRFLISAGIPLFRDVTSSDIDDYRLYLIEQNYSDGTQSLYLNNLRLFYDFLEKHQHIFANPAKGLIVRRPKEKLQPVPSLEEIKILLLQPDVSTLTGVRDRAMIETAYTSGIRGNELIRLKITDLDLKYKILRIIGKGDKERLAPLGQKAVYWLKKYLEEARPLLIKDKSQTALWISETRGILSLDTVNGKLKQYARKGGIQTRLTVHGLRRACATHMLQKGAHPVQIQKLLGHATIYSLSQYLKITITDMQKMHQRSKPGQ